MLNTSLARHAQIVAAGVCYLQPIMSNLDIIVILFCNCRLHRDIAILHSNPFLLSISAESLMLPQDISDLDVKAGESFHVEVEF